MTICFDASLLHVDNLFYTVLYIVCTYNATFFHLYLSPILQQLFNATSDGGNESNDNNDDGGLRTHPPSTTVPSPSPSPSPKSPSPKWKLQVVLTKCDLVERNDLARRMAAVHGQLRWVVWCWCLHFFLIYIMNL